MRIGVNLGPTGDWPAMLAAARTADTLGFESVGFLDHYHAPKLEWPYLCGWSLYGALAIATSRIHLLPLVIDRLNYLPGVLAKEISMLSILSGGRFELGIGAGDFFEEARAWAGQSHLINPIQNKLKIGVVPTGFESLGMDANTRRLRLSQEIQRDVA